MKGYKSKYEIKYDLISNFIEMDIAEKLRSLGFAEEYVDIVQGRMNKDISDKLSKMNQKRDGRNALRYGQDLILPKMIEYFLIDYFKTTYYQDYYFNGGEGEELFLLKESEITNDSDLMNDRNEYIEVVSDYTGFWAKSGIMHFRNNKLPQLMHLARNQKVSILAVDIKNDSYGFIELNDEVITKYHESIAGFNGKSGWSIEVDTSEFEKFDRYIYHQIAEREANC